ncbi:hypothetical protein [Streptomyces sp. NPDC002788]
MVLEARRFVNSVYGSRIGKTVEETGEADRSTVRALTRARRAGRADLRAPVAGAAA